MPTHQITIIAGPPLRTDPGDFTIRDGDELVITNPTAGLVKLILSSDTVGRLNPIPSQIVPLSPNESVSFTIENLANRLYEIHLKPTGAPNTLPPDERPDPLPQPRLLIMPFLSVAATGVSGGLEELP
ncbi:MAG: hypothetical protein IT368_18255 [Candidatus Hydrogenedentes bacterium]|nr:hypothetical protein [Candidatus Hydrogenedentota bacterium]